MRLTLVENFHSKRLFDGFENNYYDFVTEITVEENKILIKTLSFKLISELKTQIDEDSFNELIQLCNVQEITPFKNYKATDRLFLRYYIENDYLFVISTGEFQPGRFKIYLEGVWKIII